MIRQRYTPFERVLRVFMHIALIIVTISCAYPFWYVLIYSISDSKAALDNPVILWPVSPTLSLFGQLLSLKMLWSSLFNSVGVTVLGTVLAVKLTASLAYPLSVRRLKGRGAITMFLYFTMLFSGGMIPAYLLIRDLNLIDNRWALVLPGMISVYNLLVLRNFFLGIPGELEGDGPPSPDFVKAGKTAQPEASLHQAQDRPSSFFLRRPGSSALHVKRIRGSSVARHGVAR